MKVKNNKIKIFLMAAVLVAGAFLSLIGCSKVANEGNVNNSVDKVLSSYTIELDKNEIDVLSREIGIAHNCVLFSLYRNSAIDGMNATELCHYIHDYLVANSDAMGLVMLPDYMRAADSLGKVMDEIYSNIGRLIENEGTDWHLPDNVDQELIKRTMEDYYAFVNEVFLESNTYDEFENTCLNHLQALCDETETINDYFYLNACGNITFASYCAWVSLFSGYNTNTKDVRDWLRNKYEAVKEYVMEKFIKPIEEVVSADLKGGALGGAAGLSGGAVCAILTGQAYAVPIGLIGGIVVGAAAGSLFF